MQKSLAKNNKNTLLMTQGNIWKLLITFSIPLIIGNLLQQMYNTADSIIVGNFVGSNGLAAVGSGTALINLIIAFAQGASVGAGVVVSQYIGADKKDKIKISYIDMDEIKMAGWTIIANRREADIPAQLAFWLDEHSPQYRKLIA